jgi:hypothetical protein
MGEWRGLDAVFGTHSGSDRVLFAVNGATLLWYGDLYTRSVFCDHTLYLYLRTTSVQASSRESYLEGCSWLDCLFPVFWQDCTALTIEDVEVAFGSIIAPIIYMLVYSLDTTMHALAVSISAS